MKWEGAYLRVQFFESFNQVYFNINAMNYLQGLKHFWSSNQLTVSFLALLLITTLTVAVFYIRDLKKQQKTYYRIRWWKIFWWLLILYGSLCLYYLSKHIAFEELLKSIIIEVVGFVLGALITYIYLKRSYYEEFRELMDASSYNAPFEQLCGMSDKLISLSDYAPAEAKSSITQKEINVLKDISQQISCKVLVYQRFLPLEDLREIDICLHHVNSLSGIDKDLNDNDFMKRLTEDILLIYIKSHQILDKARDENVEKKLWESYRKWLDISMRIAVENIR